jgi:hypothetical protein
VQLCWQRQPLHLAKSPLQACVAACKCGSNGWCRLCSRLRRGCRHPTHSLTSSSNTWCRLLPQQLQQRLSHLQTWVSKRCSRTALAEWTLSLNQFVAQGTSLPAAVGS